MISCLKHTFSQKRSQSTFQSIGEAMVKIKGLSSLKQYLALKPIKRIKLWVTRNAKTCIQTISIFILDEMKLGITIQHLLSKLDDLTLNPDITLCFDCFFSLEPR